MAREFWSNVKARCSTWKFLADKIGSTERTLSSYASRNTMPRLDLAYRIADSLETSIDSLVSRSSDTVGSLDSSETRIINALREGSPEQQAYKTNFIETLIPSLNNASTGAQITKKELRNYPQIKSLYEMADKSGMTSSEFLARIEKLFREGQISK